MRHIDPQSDLPDGIEPAPAPDRRSDGTLIIPPLRDQVPPRPSLCDAGPCRHYHRFSTQVDAANPRAVRLPGGVPPGTPRTVQTPTGALYQAPAVFHVEVHRYCYPTVGVEMNLGALPVTECNRWDPDCRSFVNVPPGPNRMNVLGELGTQEGRRKFFQESEQGRAFHQSLADWESARATEAAEATEAESLMAGVLEDASTKRACQFCGQRFPPAEVDDTGSCSGCAALNRVHRESLQAKDPTP